MKPKLYVETTVVGYLSQRISRDVITAGHQKITRKWWATRRHAFDLYVSELVLDEAAAGDPDEASRRLSLMAGMSVLESSAQAEALATVLLKRKALPAKARGDAVHLAIAAVNRMEYLLTWNYRHLINASLALMMARVCKKHGYRCPTICTPEQLLVEE